MKQEIAQVIEKTLLEAWIGGVHDDYFEDKSWPKEATFSGTIYYHFRTLLEKRVEELQEKDKEFPDLHVWLDCDLPKEMWEQIGKRAKKKRYDLVVVSWNYDSDEIEWGNKAQCVANLPVSAITIHALMELKYFSYTAGSKEVVKDLKNLTYWKDEVPSLFFLFIPYGRLRLPPNKLAERIEQFGFPILAGDTKEKKSWGILRPQNPLDLQRT